MNFLFFIFVLFFLFLSLSGCSKSQQVDYLNVESDNITLNNEKQSILLEIENPYKEEKEYTIYADCYDSLMIFDNVEGTIGPEESKTIELKANMDFTDDWPCSIHLDIGEYNFFKQIQVYFR